MGKNVGKNISKNISGKHSQKVLVHTKNLKQRHLKLLQKELIKKQQKQLVIGNKIANRFTKVSKKLQQINSEKIANKHDKEKPKEWCVSPEERQEIVDELRLK